MSKEIAKKESTELAQPIDMSEWGSNFSQQDLIIPKVLVMQSQSALVAEDKMRVGDMVNSTTNEKVGDYLTPLKLLPFYMTKTWITLTKDGSKFVKISADEGTQKPFEEMIDGVLCKNYHQYNFFCLTEAMSVPCVISFKSTAHKTGQNLANFMYITQPTARRLPASNWINFETFKDKNDKGSFASPRCTPSVDSTPEQLKKCLEWIRTLKTTSYKVEEEVETDAPEATVSKNTPY